MVAGQNIMSTPELQLMEPLLRLLQLFCENHNIDMQVILDLLHALICILII